MRPASLAVVAALGFACFAVFASCKGSSNTGFGDDTKDGSTVQPGPDADLLGTADASNPGCKAQCSSDLHALVDCNGRTLSTCPPDQGCGADGKCVPACDAAANAKSSVGCDYYVYPPPFFSGSTSCTGAFIANTWGSPVKVTLERGAQTFDASLVGYLPTGTGSAITYKPLTGSVIPPGAVALVLLNREGGACPSGTQSATGPVAFKGTGIGQAFRIKTDAPVVAYDIFPYGGGSTAVSSATLLIPSTAWGDNYVGVTAYPETISGAYPWLGIVAAEDGTQVTVSPSQAILGGGGVAGTGKGVPVTYNLNKGQYIQLEQQADLTGSIIKANKPIGSWAGNECSQVPKGPVACDGMHQQVPPVRALGYRYVAARYRNRHPGTEESPPWRIVGAVDGTTLTYNPPQPGAPAVIGSGQVAEFNATGPFVITAQDDKHPFFFASYMTGCAVPGQGAPQGCAGDPEFVNVVPPDQYLASYIFFTDPTYPETNLVFVRKKAADGTFKDVNLDCVGNIGGWQAAGPDYEYTRVDLVTGNFQKQGTCDNGRHEAKSDAPFGLTVWGWGSAQSTGFFSEAVSYAYPAGASIQTINQVIVPAVPR